MHADSNPGPDGSAGEAQTDTHPAMTTNKRPRPSTADLRYPRKRSLKACHVCRTRKTKCDNVQPTCGFCASINIACSYDDAERDHSSFDNASLEILRQLGRITESQDDLLQLVRRISGSSSQTTTLSLGAPIPVVAETSDTNRANGQHQNAGTTPQHGKDGGYDWLGPQPDSASSTPTVAGQSAAVRWLGVLTSIPSGEAFPGPVLAQHLDSGFLEGADGEGDENLSPLQRATRAVDDRPSGTQESDSGIFPHSQLPWQSTENIPLLQDEETLFDRFLRRISSWFELFDPTRTFTARVPHLAIRNAGLLNAILALSCFHLSLEETAIHGQPIDQSAAVQYYYQTLHYVQKAMQYSSYRTSLELTATTIIVSTYEMLHGSSNDWQRHLQGVFWMLRSRQIEVERPSLESTIWWAWLQQDVWAAFREKRRTYSTWIPKKTCRDLEAHELAGRAVWILAQVVNFCALDSANDTTWAIEGRTAWSGQLHSMLSEWESCLTVEFSPLPSPIQDESVPFKPRLIHPQSYGLALQAFHAAQLLLWTSEPCLGGIDAFTKRLKMIQESIDTICGIGLTVSDDAASLLSSQYVFTAGLFVQDSQQRRCIVQMLDAYHERCHWPLLSLGAELTSIHDGTKTLWATHPA